jgi:hypothetical protein
MKTRMRIGALLGAGALSLGIVGMALAIEVKDAHQNITVTWDANGDPVIGGGFSNSDECDAPAPGWVIFHFVQSGQGTVANAPGNNLLDVDFEDEADANDVPEDSIQGNGTNVDWFVAVDASDGSVTMVTANSNVVGGEDELRVSHICVGDQPEQESQAPSDAPSDAPSEVPSAPPSEVPSQVIESEAPSEVPSQSVAVETDAPSESPFQSVEADTDAPSEPNTATVDGAGNVGAPGDGAWLLVVALGVLLASIVVLTPARAKAPRR